MINLIKKSYKTGGTKKIPGEKIMAFPSEICSDIMICLSNVLVKKQKEVSIDG